MTTQMLQPRALRAGISSRDTISSTIFPPSLVSVVLSTSASPRALTAANAGDYITCRMAIRLLLPPSTMPNVVSFSPRRLSSCWIMAIWGHRCCTYSMSIYLSGNVDYNAFFLTFLPSACAPLCFIFWIISRVYFALPKIYLCTPCLVPIFVRCVLLPDTQMYSTVK